MVRSLSLSTFTSFGNSGVSGSDVSWRRHFKLIRKTHIKSGIPRQCVFHVPSFHFEANRYTFKKRGFRVEAGWPFQGGEQELEAISERSEGANEDILIFFFQLDLATQVQVWRAAFSGILVCSLVKFFLAYFLLSGGWSCISKPFVLLDFMELQRALNLEEYEIAQQLRNRLAEVVYHYILR